MNHLQSLHDKTIANTDVFYDLQAKSKEVLRSYLVYILEERLTDPSVCDMDELRSCVQIWTNKDVVNPITTPIYFTPKYGNTIDLARQLPSKLSVLLCFMCPFT